jgi:hypothetical protein
MAKPMGTDPPVDLSPSRQPGHNRRDAAAVQRPVRGYRTQEHVPVGRAFAAMVA